MSTNDRKWFNHFSQRLIVNTICNQIANNQWNDIVRQLNDLAPLEAAAIAIRIYNELQFPQQALFLVYIQERLADL